MGLNKSTIEDDMVRILCLFVLMSGFFTASFSYARPLKKNYSLPHVPSQLIIKFKNHGAKISKNNFLQEMGAQVVQQFSSNGAMLVQLPYGLMDKSAAGLKRMIDEISVRPDVEYVEPNWILHARVKPNDPRYDELYALKKSRSRTADIFAQEAWTKTTGSRDVLVAVIDSGVDYKHQDLAENYWNNPGENGTDANGKNKKNNGIDDDHNGMIDDWGGWNFVKNNNNPMDDNHHGTHCAGTIGAVGDNGVGVVGVNWNVSIVGLKFLDSEGNGTLANGVLAIEYATKLGVHIMSNSWGGDEYSETMAAAIRNASAAGILFVVAAGNNTSNNDVSLDYPSSYNIDNIVSVAAIDSDGELAGFSNYGAKTVHIAAPGAQILSTFPGNDYGVLDGTSMAAPHVAGAAALIKARFPLLKARELKARLLGGTVRTKPLQGKVITGLLNIENALDDDQTPPAALNKVSVLSSGANSINLEWEPSLDNGRDKYAYGYELRRSVNPIDSQADWQSAIVVSLAISQQNAGIVQARAENIPMNSSGYFSIRSFDRAGNLSDISNSIPYAAKRVSAVYENKKNSLAGLSIDGSWGLEDVAGMGKVLSDSPGEVSGYDSTTSLTLPPIRIHSNDVVLSFRNKYEFELGFDYGYVEISADNGDTWQQIAQLNGAQNWTEAIYSLSPFLSKSDSSLLVRFRVTSDRTHSMDGWLLSEISVFN